MVQKKLTERPRGRRGKYTFGARENKHAVGAGQGQAETLWRRDVHTFSLAITTPQTNEKSSESLIGFPGQGFTREIRRVAMHAGIAWSAASSGTPVDDVANVAGVLEFAVGISETQSAFEANLVDSAGVGLFRRYVSFAQGAGTLRFWLPSGWNQLGSGAHVAAGGLMTVYVGIKVVAMTTSAGQLRCYGCLSTQEREKRVYA